MVRLVYVESNYRNTKNLSNEFYFFRVLTDSYGVERCFVITNDVKAQEVYKKLGFHLSSEEDIIDNAICCDEMILVSTTSEFIRRKEVFKNASVIIMLDKLLPDSLRCYQQELESIITIRYPRTEVELLRLADAYL